jgi:Beta protein
MAYVDFSQYYYFPCLQCSEPEQIGYRELSDEDKDSVLPIIELSQVKYESSFEDTIIAVSAMMGNRPFILDLSKDRAPSAFVPKKNPDHVKIAKLQAAQDAYNHVLTSLLSPADGFAGWRALAKNFPNAVPVLQFTDPGTQSKNILRQAVQLSKDGFEQIAFRITQETNEEIYDVIGQVGAVLESAAHLFLIIDCGQGRQRIAERADFAKLAMARVIEEIEPSQSLLISAVCLNDAYTTPPDGILRFYESCSRELWGQASEKFPFLFGDYGANYRHKKTNTFMPPEWKAQVVYPLSDGWLVYRHPDAQDVQGWIEGAKAVLGHDDCDDENNCWGSQLVDRAFEGDISGVASARFWHGAKINMHIHRQIRYAQESVEDGEVS